MAFAIRGGGLASSLFEYSNGSSLQRLTCFLSITLILKMIKQIDLESRKHTTSRDPDDQRLKMFFIVIESFQILQSANN